MPPPVTDTLGHFIAETDYASISAKALANAKLHILDTLGVALAAMSTPVATIALDYCKRAGGSLDSSV
jgi:2-methylcitrate dehydratase PrpD